jgi:hypothetical protein
MSFIARKIMMGSGAVDGYKIDQSLIFRRADTGYMYRTPSETSNRNVWTVSAWVKRSNVTIAANDYHTIFGLDDGSYGDTTHFDLVFYRDIIGAWLWNSEALRTNRLFRDVSAWYHIVLAVNTNNSTAGNRWRLYINGVEETSFSADTNYTGLTANNMSGTKQIIGNSIFTHTNNYFNGNIAEFHNVDGQQLSPSSFGETNSDTGQWVPKEFSGSHGTNGFYLKFASGALGTDSSGNGNNFTTSNIANTDVVTDSPTNNCMTLNSLETNSSTITEGSLKLVTSNHSDTTGTIRIPNTGKWYWEVTCTAVGGAYFGIYKTSYTKDAGAWVNGSHIVLEASTGKKYSYPTTAATYMSGAVSNGDVVGVAVDCDNGKIFFADSNTWGDSGNPATGSNPAGTFTASDGWKPGFYGPGGGNAINLSLNFGQKTFSYTPPSGFSALTASNLPDPAIALPAEHFNPHIYTGSNNTNAITGVGFQPDLVWVKQRDVAYNHQLHDAVRGAAAGLIMSDNSAGENSSYPIASFDSDGFTPASGNVTGVNTGSMVGWFWKAGGTAPSKTYVVKVVSDSGNKYRFDDFAASTQTVDLQEGGTYTFDQSDSSNSGHPLRFSTTSNGSHGGGSEYTTGVTTSGTPGSAGAYTRITVAASTATLYYYCTAHSGMGGQVNTNSTYGSSYFDGDIKGTVSANSTSGFSIVNWIPNGTETATIPHGLGVAPDMVFYKRYNGTSSWFCWTTAIDGSNDYLVLNGTDAAVAVSQAGGTSFTSSFIRATNYGASGSPEVVSYCFASKEGFSKIGAYTGNGSGTGNAGGPTIVTGFKPALVITKRTDATGYWGIFDAARAPGNVAAFPALFPNTSDAEVTGTYLDLLSNGFKIRIDSTHYNADGGTYLYMAFAESPFKYANAR